MSNMHEIQKRTRQRSRHIYAKSKQDGRTHEKTAREKTALRQGGAAFDKFGELEAFLVPTPTYLSFNESQPTTDSNLFRSSPAVPASKYKSPRKKRTWKGAFSSGAGRITPRTADALRF